MGKLASIVLNWIGGGKTLIPIRFLKSVDIPGSGQEQDIIKPIVLSGELTNEITKQTQLDEIGLTIEEMKAAINGKRICVIFPEYNYRYEINRANLYEDNGDKIIEFAFISIQYIQSGINEMNGYSIVSNITTGNVTVAYIEY